MNIWTEPPKAYAQAIRACIRGLSGMTQVPGVDAADAVVFIIDDQLWPRLRAASDYALAAPRFKDRVLTIAVGALDDVPWILQRLAYSHGSGSKAWWARYHADAAARRSLTPAAQKIVVASLRQARTGDTCPG